MPKQISVYVKRWYPSKLELGHFEEVAVSDMTVKELKAQVS